MAACNGGRSMLNRIITAAIGIPIILLAVYLGNPWLAAIVGAVALLALSEYLSLQGLSKMSSLFLSSLITVPYYVNVLVAFLPWEIFLLIYIIAATAAGLVLFPRLLGVERTFALGWGGIYIPLLLSGLVYIRDMEQGFFLALLVLAVTWGTDSGAFFAGMAWGKSKLAPTLSPNKTWVGAWGGLLTGVIIGLSYGIITDSNLFFFASWGAAASIMGQIGDLCESAVKRRAGVKDSGSTLPGHGGFYDRVDSLLFTAAVSYIFFGMGI